MEEYMDLNHAEIVPVADLQKQNEDVFYLPMHAVHKEHSTTTKIRAVFDASAKSTTGVSLNDTLLVGPTVHPPLIDVLLQFRLHKIAITADVSKMYRAVELTQPDRDLHRFVWRSKPDNTLVDYRMTRITFGVSASAFAANMSVKQNAIDHATEFPQAANVVNTSFYVDDCLTGANSIEEAVELQRQLHGLFAKGEFLLRKWNSNNTTVLQNISPELRDSQPLQLLPTNDEYTKTLGIEWSAKKDHFRLTVAKPPPLETLTKRALVSDIAKTFDVLGWFSPATIKVKILLQKVWEERIDWDNPVPMHIKDIWSKWRTELPELSHKLIPRCHFDTDTEIVSTQLHGFSDAVSSSHRYFWSPSNLSGNVQDKGSADQASLNSKARTLWCTSTFSIATPRQTSTLHIPLSNIHAWTDSTVVLNWLDGSPKRFKNYVGNRISAILDLMPPDKWKHVNGLQNPADCASRGLYPSELLDHPLWWSGPDWLKQDQTNWPTQVELTPNSHDDEGTEISLVVIQTFPQPVIPVDRFSKLNQLKRVTCWIIRFIKNSRFKDHSKRILTPLTMSELQEAENYWIKIIQAAHFKTEIEHILSKQPLSKSNSLLILNPIVDNYNLLRVGGRRQLSATPYHSKHPLILHAKHKLTHFIIHLEHLRLLHAGPTLLIASLNRRYHIVGGSKTVRSIVRKCVVCRKLSAKPHP